MQASEVKTALKQLANPKQAQLLQGYFKTGKGQYGEGDIFLGVMVPKQRLVAKNFSSLPLKEIATLLKTPVHEHRFTALAILVGQYKKLQSNKKQTLSHSPLPQVIDSEAQTRGGEGSLPAEASLQQAGVRGKNKHQEIHANADLETIVEFYLKNAKQINNWDLVDSSAPYILGHYLLRQYLTSNTGRQSAVNKIKTMAKSKNLWERRMAIVATFPFIQQKIFQPSLDLAVQLMHDPHDLIHKATGWMLREVGKKDEKILLKFLDQHAQTLPRTCLRYTLERLGKKIKRVYYKK